MKRERMLTDKLICTFNEIRYSVLEKILLQSARRQHEAFYNDSNEYPLITIYTPTYNRGELLMDRALSSVLKQTYKNFEYLIIGDHCTDNTSEMIAKVNDPRVRFFNLPEKSNGYPTDAEGRWLAGPVGPANKALEMAHGKWIARLDDDDIFTSDHVERLLSFAQKDDYEFVSALVLEKRFGQENVVDGVRANDPYFTQKEKIENDHSPKIGGTSTWFYRSYLRFIKYNIHCWRKKWNRVNDLDLSLRLFKSGARMGFIETVVGYVLPRPGEETIGLDAYLIAEKEGYRVHL